jgi:7,8-dihydropterin-6-yl-methyl-4-(beta-D-ribofuranosyl)aminobenzene 5'-phosphate synthase
LIKRYGRPRIPIVLHPDAFLQRKNVFPDGHETQHIPPSRHDLDAEDVQIVEERGLTMLVGDHALVTGQIARTTPFEKGNPTQVAWIEDQWQPDPWIHDDQAVIMNVKDKGLVVLTGCGHAGVVNTLRHSVEGIQPEHHRPGTLYWLARDAFNRPRISQCFRAQQCWHADGHWRIRESFKVPGSKFKV